MTALVIVVGGVVYLNYLNSIGDLSGSSGRTGPVATTATRTFTDAQIQEAIAKFMERGLDRDGLQDSASKHAH